MRSYRRVGRPRGLSGTRSTSLALAEEAEPELRGPRQYEWVERLEAEHDNIQAVFFLVARSRRHRAGLRLARALRRLWHMSRGYFDEGRRLLE